MLLCSFDETREWRLRLAWSRGPRPRSPYRGTGQALRRGLLRTTLPSQFDSQVDAVLAPYGVGRAGRYRSDSVRRGNGGGAWRGGGRPRPRSPYRGTGQALRQGLLRTTWWRSRLAWSRQTPPQVLRRGLLRTTWWRRRVVHGNRSCRPSRVPILSHHYANCMAAAGDGFPPPRERRVDGCFRRHPSCGRTRVPAEAQAPAMMSLSFWTFSFHQLNRMAMSVPRAKWRMP